MNECKDINKKIRFYIKELNELAEKYKVLNKKSGNRYDWRIQSLYEKLELLNELLEEDNYEEVKSWKTCWLEDLAEYEESLK